MSSFRVNLRKSFFFMLPNHLLHSIVSDIANHLLSSFRFSPTTVFIQDTHVRINTAVPNGIFLSQTVSFWGIKCACVYAKGGIHAQKHTKHKGSAVLSNRAPFMLICCRDHNGNTKFLLLCLKTNVPLMFCYNIVCGCSSQTISTVFC